MQNHEVVNPLRCHYLTEEIKKKSKELTVAQSSHQISRKSIEWLKW